ncbi:hypothetical protein PS664_02245 [Pseudomonas fluorescens]|nr:hypothetical protein PS664_02245 [Pseudomonas fluorescens]
MSLINLLQDDPNFSFGIVGMTAGVQALVQDDELDPLEYLMRHLQGDWGDLSDEDQQANADALAHGNRVLSSYKVSEDQWLWIITEADRSITTLLLPEEY